ncbi:MAG: hypothetical protein RLN99_09670 [Kiloniellaceae bacterium]
MSEATVDRRQRRHEKALEIVLRGTTVPLKDGGAAVFPNGLPTKGLRLEAWQFYRYRTELEKVMLGQAANRRSLLLRTTVLLTFLGLFLCSAAGSFLKAAPYFQSPLDHILPDLAALLVAVGALAVFFGLHAQAMRFTRQFDGAPALGRFAYLRERFLGTVAAESGKPTALVLVALLPSALAGFLAYIGVTGTGGLIGITIFVLPLTVYGAWRSALLYVYLTFYRRHGHAPMLADLHPVDPPA